MVKKAVKNYRLIKKNREWHKKTGMPTIESVMELNKKHWPISDYKPLSERFNPDWFRPAAIDQEKNKGKYTTSPFGTKAFRDYWDEQLKRCRYGYKTHGFHCPGDLYFFLNFYILPVPQDDPETGEPTRIDGHPHFWEIHYAFAHYVEWGRKLKMDGICLKPRGVGWSEYVAGMGDNLYTTKKRSVTSFLASNEDYLLKDGILSKAWFNLDWLNDNTQGGFKQLRQKQDSKLHKRASLLNNEKIEFGWRSEIIAKIVDKPDKVRGNRTDLLVFEEAGSFKHLVKSISTSRALTEIGGRKFGYKIAFGTGGDEGSSGENLMGLMKVFSEPYVYGMLGFKHNFTENREVVTTGFFFPAYACFMQNMNHQGITDYEKTYAYFIAERKKFEDAGAIEELRHFKAEYPFFPNEAFARGGTNIFDTIKAANQLLRLKHADDIPKIKVGELVWVYKKGTSVITGVRFQENPNGRVLILEEPEVDSQGNPFKNLYIGGVDSIDFGSQNSLIGDDGSKFACVIKKRYLHAEKTGNMYVAMYKDRPKDERDAYEIALKMAIFYNAKLNVERTRKEVISYFRNQNMHKKYLAKQPTILQNNISPNARRTIDSYGTPINEKVIVHYLNKVKEYNADFSEIIFFEEMLHEIINYAYETKNRYDLIPAMGMCEMLDEDLDAGGVIAKSVVKETSELKLYGYYRDPVTGIKKHGVLPDSVRKSAEQMHRELDLVPVEPEEMMVQDGLTWVDPYEESMGKHKFELNY